MIIRKVLEYWSVAQALSDTRVHRLILCAALLLVPVRGRLFGKCPIKLHLRVLGRAVPFYVRDGADIATLREVFVEREYEIEVEQEPKNIADIGAHIGSASILFACTYPQARIRSYEPDPANYEILVRNTEQFTTIVTSNVALSDTTGPIPFFHNTESSIGSSIVHRPGTEEVAVVSTTLDALLHDEIDLVKFDVEGAEYKMFAAAKNIKKCPTYVGELHYDLTGKTLDDFRRVFEGFKLARLREMGDRAIAHFELIP